MAAVYQMIDHNERMGLRAGDLVLCTSYWLDRDKLTVICRIWDGFDPACTLHRDLVIPVGDDELLRLRYEHMERSR